MLGRKYVLLGVTKIPHEQPILIFTSLKISIKLLLLLKVINIHMWMPCYQLRFKPRNLYFDLLMYMLNLNKRVPESTVNIFDHTALKVFTIRLIKNCSNHFI